MSYKRTTYTYKISEILSDDIKLSNTVRQMFSSPDFAEEIGISHITPTAYRRIHEHLTAVLDRAIEVLSEPKPEKISEVVVGLTKGLILVEYQLARRQISKELGDKLKEVLTSLLDSLKESDAVKKFERARTLLDALAVLVYRRSR